MHGGNCHPALCHGIGGHRAVYTAGKHHHAFAAGADRHAAHRFPRAGIHIRPVADFHLHGDLRRVNVHFHIVHCLQNPASDLPGNALAIRLKGLVLSSGAHFKRAGRKAPVRHRVFQFRYGRFSNSVHCLVHPGRRAYAHDPKGIGTALHYLCFRILRKAGNKHAALHFQYLAMQPFQIVLQALTQQTLKIRPI